MSITRHRAIDRARSRQRRARLIAELQESGAADLWPSHAPDIDAIGAEAAAAVRSALRVLPPDQRRAIELAFFADLSHPEIAEALQHPRGTIKARIRRGLLKMRESLQVGA